MASRLLQGFGVALVLALVVGAVGGLLVVKDRVRIVVAADETPVGPDPVALLRDDVQTLARDVAAMPDLVRSASEQLAAHVEERAAARHDDVRRAMPDVRALTAEIAALRRDVDAMRTAVAAAPVAVPTAPGETAVAVEEPGAAAVSPPSDPSGTPARTEPAARAPRDGFLSFSLPSARFRFDEPQDYNIVPELSRVGFDAKSTLHDFSGVTSRVRGTFRADLDDPQGRWSGDVVASAATLATGVDGRDEGMREHLDVVHHADIHFVVEGFAPAANGVDVAQRKLRGEVRGTMTIRGQSKPLTMPIAVEIDAQQRVVLTGQVPLKLSDYGIPVPSKLGVINMQDDVVVWVALRARAATGGRK